MFRTSYYQSELEVTKMKTMKERVGQVYWGGGGGGGGGGGVKFF